MHADDLYAAGVQFWHEDGPRGAVADLRAALAERPEDPLMNYAVGFACADLGSLTEAKERLLAAERLGYREAQLHQLLAWVLLTLGDVAEADTHAEHALGFPLETAKRAWTLGLLGKTREIAGNYVDALALYQEALILEPQFAPAAIGTGRVHLTQGRFDVAARHLERGLGIAPDDGEAWFALGFAENRNGNHARAVEALTEALSRGHKGAVLAQEMTFALLETEDYRGALGWAKQTLELSQEDDLASWAHATAAVCERALGHTEAEFVHREVAAELLPLDASALFNLGIVLGEAGRWTEADQAFERAHQLRPDDDEIRSAIGWVHENTERSSDA